MFYSFEYSITSRIVVAVVTRVGCVSYDIVSTEIAVINKTMKCYTAWRECEEG